LEATPGNLLPVIVRAIQELKEENERLKAELESVKSVKEEIVELKQLVARLNTNDEDYTQMILNNATQQQEKMK
jgi:cell shape-determining protein MreC